MNYFTLLLSLLFTSILTGQSIIDFEEYDLSPETFLDGSDGSGGFSSGGIFLPNIYDTSYFFWSGWSISNTTDVETQGFTNQYSAIAGSGAESSSNYATTFVSGESIIRLDDNSKKITGISVSNGTYPFFSMQEGDAFAKKFGGETGDDPDFFLLTIKKYLDGSLSQDSVDFYLADYRFEDNTEDYILSDWAFIDLSSLGEMDSLSLTLSSSDVGAFGMNTPAYFCIDNVVVDNVSTNQSIVTEALSVFPNPAKELVYIKNIQDANFITMYNSIGMKVAKFDIINSSINVSTLKTGKYIGLVNGNVQKTISIVKM